VKSRADLGAPDLYGETDKKGGSGWVQTRLPGRSFCRLKVSIPFALNPPAREKHFHIAGAAQGI